MAVVRVALVAADVADATSEFNGLLAEIVRRKYTLKFVVYCDTHRDSQVTIIASGVVPQIGDTFSALGDTDTNATCVAVRPARTKNPRVWMVEADFDTDRLVSGIVNNPLSQPPEISYATVTIEKPLMRDVTGVLIRNSAGEPFDPPLLYPVKRLQVTITENLAAYDAEEGADYAGAVNDDTYGVWPPYTVKLVDRVGKRGIGYGQIYYQVTTILELNPLTYAEFLLDQGFRDFDKKLIRDPLDFSVPGNPTLLNGRGYPLRDSTAILAADIDADDTSVTHDAQDSILFPPGPTIVSGFFEAPHWYFFIKIDDEIMRVSVNDDAGTFTVDARGAAGTTAASHTTGATITLEPYFMFYYPVPALDFDALNLPSF